MKYDKLVRDKIPEIIKKDGENPVIYIAGKEEYFKKLKKKLQEEVEEFLEESNKEELADILEVVCSLALSLGVSLEALEKERKRKHEEKGGFDEKIILKEIL